MVERSSSSFEEADLVFCRFDLDRFFVFPGDFVDGVTFLFVDGGTASSFLKKVVFARCAIVYVHMYGMWFNIFITTPFAVRSKLGPNLLTLSFSSV